MQQVEGAEQQVERLVMGIRRHLPERHVVPGVGALRALEGAYALVALTNKKLIGARDPLGIRPLILGELNGAYILCSETCALDAIGASFVRNIDAGEVVVIGKDMKAARAAMADALREPPRIEPSTQVAETR